MNSASAKSNRRVVIVMVFTFVLGMAVALAVFLLWRSHGANLQPSLTAMALVVCPPFILSYAIAAAPDSAFSLVLGVGTILFANGCLYAGVAVGIYAVVTLVKKKHSPQRHRGHREE